MGKDELIEALEDAANFMRGMCIDPAIALHVKCSLQGKVTELDVIIDEALSDE